MTLTCLILSLAFHALGATFYAVQLCLIWRKNRSKPMDLKPPIPRPVRT